MVSFQLSGLGRYADLGAARKDVIFSEAQLAAPNIITRSKYMYVWSTARGIINIIPPLILVTVRSVSTLKS